MGRLRGESEYSCRILFSASSSYKCSKICQVPSSFYTNMVVDCPRGRVVNINQPNHPGRLIGIFRRCWRVKTCESPVYIRWFIWVWVNTYRYIFSGMNIHLPAILGFTRYQGFDPSPFSFMFYRLKQIMIFRS